MSRFLDKDLALLPPLPLDATTFEEVRQARGAEIADRLIEEGFEFNVQNLETDPMVRANARAGGMREMLLRARFNDALKASHLATSYGAFLDHLGADQTPAVWRKPLVESPRDFALFPEDWEGDEPFRRRIQLAPETLSAAGPGGAYLGFAEDVPGVRVAACWAPMSFGGTRTKPFTPLGEEHVVIVSTTDDGVASPALCAAVEAALRPDDRRPVGDFVLVFPAEIVPYRIEVVLYLPEGADWGGVKVLAERQLALQAERQLRPSAAQLREMIYAAAAVRDARGTAIPERIDVVAPAGDINPGPIAPGATTAAYRAPLCTEIVVRVEPADE